MSHDDVVDESNTNISVNAVYAFPTIVLFAKITGPPPLISTPPPFYCSTASECIVGDDVAAHKTRRRFHFDPAAQREVTLAVRRIILDAIVLNARRAALHLDSAA